MTENWCSPYLSTSSEELADATLNPASAGLCMHRIGGVIFGEDGGSNMGALNSLAVLCGEVNESDAMDRVSATGVDVLLLTVLKDSLFRKASLLLSMKVRKALFSIRETC